jgi:hypothetical protein
MFGVTASTISLLWLALAFGWIPLLGDDDGKLRLLLVIILDVLLFGLGVFGVIRGLRHRKSWLLGAVVLCAPLVHLAGSAVQGEQVILFFAAPTLAIMVLTGGDIAQRLFTRRRHVP